ncbi:MAG: potassium channel family protein [Candidatus Micrarchaeota archaeon]
MVSTNIRLTIALFSIVLMLAIGTVVYHNIEGWDWVDSFYFTGVTLTTVGYGDLHPTHDISKLFTVAVAFSGITVVFYSVAVVANVYFNNQQERIEKRLKIIEKTQAREEQKLEIIEHLKGKRH